MKHVQPSINEKIVRSFLSREMATQESIIDRVPVFGKRYHDAVDRLEDLEVVGEALDEVLKGKGG